MKMPQLVSAAFATAALASASFPALSWTVWPDVDFEWYANVGKPLTTTVITVADHPVYPAAREGMIWAPARWEWRVDHHVLVRGHWIRDDYAERVAQYTNGNVTEVAGPVRYDRRGNMVAIGPTVLADTAVQ